MKHFTLLAGMAFSLTATAQITDGGFEAGVNGGDWTEASSNFGSPLCSQALCGTGGGPCVPNTGTWYVWFGGATNVETGSVEQEAVIPAGSDVRLQMFVKLALPTTNELDRMEIKVDGNLLTTISALDSADYEEYTLVDLDVTPFADGQPHTIRFEGFQTTASVFNVLLDDVSLEVDGSGVGLFENESLAGIQVFPNPANATITLSFNALHGEGLVTISDLTGKVVSTERVAEVNQRVLHYDASQLVDGLYLVTVEMKEERFTQRVMVAH